MAVHSTITLRTDLKETLALLKGSRSWDVFLADMLDKYPSERTLREIERRLEEIRTGKVQVIPWEEVKADMARRRRKRGR